MKLMRIELNGQPHELPEGATLDAAVRASGAGEGGRGVAVALDGEVVPRSEWERTPLREGQAVEVLAAIQGGAPEADEAWDLGGRHWRSRLIAGTGGFRSLEQMKPRWPPPGRRSSPSPCAASTPPPRARSST